MKEQYDIKYLSNLLRERLPEIWERLGWVMSTLNELPEQEDKDQHSYLASVTRVFLRNGQFGINIRNELEVFNEIAILSCLQQGLKFRPELRFSRAHLFEEHDLHQGYSE